MKIIFAGTPSNAADTLQSLLASETGLFQVVAVLTRPDAPVGRKRTLTASPVAQVATMAGLPIIKAKRVNADVVQSLKSFGADLGVVVAYGALFDAKCLAALPRGWINIHYSMLPRWRGAAPVQNAILHGDTTTGVTIFQLDEGMDTGPIWLAVPTEIQQQENSKDLLARLTHLGISALNQVLPEIASGLKNSTPQLDRAEPLAVKPTRGDAKLDFANDAAKLENKIRAFNPEPMAYAIISTTNDTVRILDARAHKTRDLWPNGHEISAPVGAVSIEKGKVFVHCGNQTLLELKEIQPAGKKPMDATDWARGLQSEVAFK